MNTDIFLNRLSALKQAQAQAALTGIRRGIEKESLRIGADGYLARTPHPIALGAALTHPYMTTDYSEALLEFITPPLESPHAVLEWLYDLHAFAYAHIGTEHLWAGSMPCTLTHPTHIPIAHYGHSHLGQLKHIYRRGLAHRYGKAMQIISGVHFNFSLPEAFWHFYQTYLQNSDPLQTFIDQQYFALIRNFWRHAGLLLLLFGASPAICGTFLRHPHSALAPLPAGGVYAPQGTSLRMSDLGYQNLLQNQLEVSYDSLAAYVSGLTKAVNTPEAQYERFGSVAQGQYEQLNANLLQIEAEYYSPIRPKRTVSPHERPLHGLKTRGVEYIEVRILDLNPYAPVGVTLDELCFLESFLLFCLLTPSPLLAEDEFKQLKSALQTIAYQGQDIYQAWTWNNSSVTLQAYANQILDQVAACAQLLDTQYCCTHYSQAIIHMRALLDDSSQLLSARMLADMQAYHECSYPAFAYHWSTQHRDFFVQRGLTFDRQRTLETLAHESMAAQQRIERADTGTLQQYIMQYLGAR